MHINCVKYSYLSLIYIIYVYKDFVRFVQLTERNRRLEYKHEPESFSQTTISDSLDREKFAHRLYFYDSIGMN